MKRTPLWGFVLLLPWLTACSLLGKPAPEHALNHWVDTELAPYLIEQFAQSPRFQGKPLIIVGLDNETVRTDIDALTRSLRDTLRDKLLSVPGIQLVRRETGDLSAHHRSLESVVCAQEQAIHYYIGLDVKQDNLTGQLTVAVRALDAQNNLGWVSGFGKHYRGPVSEREQRALAQVSKDDYLRGLRALPFSDDQNDLVASYLSHNLSCLLREHREGGVLLHVVREAPAGLAYFDTVFQLVENFVNRYNEVTLTEQPEQANVLLTLGVHTIHQPKGLYLVSVTLARRDDGVLIGGMATQAYVQVRGTSRRAAQLRDLQARGRPTPASSVPAPARSHDVAAPAQASPQQPTARLLPGMISTVAAITPRNPVACRQPEPWASGVRRLHSGDTLRSGDCFALELTLQADAYVQWMYRDTFGNVYRLLPSGCDGLQGDSRVQANRVALYPSPEGAIPVLGLGQRTGTEKVYVIAARDADAHQHVQQVAAQFAAVCQAAPGPGANRVAHWEAVLHQLAGQAPGDIEWQSFTIEHL